MARRVEMCMAIQMVVLVAALAMILSSVGSAAPQAPAPTGKFLIDCEVKIGVCGFEVFRSVFQNWTGISVNCCHQLVFMGKTCHDALVNDYISHPFFKGNKTQVLEASAKIWNRCVSLPPASQVLDFVAPAAAPV